MKLNIKKISNIINATAIGDDTKVITGVSSFDDANPDQLTFASEPKFLNHLKKTKAGAIIVPQTFELNSDIDENIIVLKCLNPRLGFFTILKLFHPEQLPDYNISSFSNIGSNFTFGSNIFIGPNVFIGKNVTIGDNVHIMPNVYIGNDTFIGNNSTVKPNVTIMEKSIIGSYVIIHSGTVIGSDGFGFTQQDEKHEKLIHTGFVQIGDNVEIGACNTIDRGTLGKTLIGSGVKTDNLVHIAHNVRVGDNSLIVAQVGIAGSTQVGNNVIIAGKAGISGHLKIGNNTIIGPYAGVSSNVGDNQIVSGAPHTDHKRWLKIVNIIKKLPELRKIIFSLEKRMSNIENKL